MMKDTVGFFLLLTLPVSFVCTDVQNGVFCASPQYLDFGKTGTIHCRFHELGYGILWYNTTHHEQNDPILHFQNGIKAGVGFTSGEFDIYPNGSLIINTVFLRHETHFQVAFVLSRSSKPVFTDVRVVVRVTPEMTFPFISLCGNVSNICFTDISNCSLPVECTVRDARPRVTLNFMSRTLKSDIHISNNMAISKEKLGFTTKIGTTDFFCNTNLLVLLVCKAWSAPGMLEKSESLILIQNAEVGLPSAIPSIVHVKVSQMLELTCTEDDFGYLVWKKLGSFEDGDQEVLLYSIFIGMNFTKVLANYIHAGENGSLVIPVSETTHEGIYVCIYGNGLLDNVTFQKVAVIVPALPVIKGCFNEQYCVIEGKEKGTLTCQVKGIRPKVQLEWETLHKNDKAVISFNTQHLMVTDDGKTFDITLTAAYHINDLSRDEISIVCKMSGSYDHPFNTTSKVASLILNGINALTPQNAEDTTIQGENTYIQASNNGITILIAVVVVLVVFAFTVCATVVIAFIQKAARTQKNSLAAFEEEMVSMIATSLQDRQNTTSDSGKTIIQNYKVIPEGNVNLKDIFLKQLKEKYTELYNGIQPVPYIKEKMFSVGRLFVENGLEFWDPFNTGDDSCPWKKLTSYQNLFTDPRVKSPIRIVEGGAGYGKSTLALQFAYDWCNDISISALRDIEILILLRMRQLGGVTSIFKAVKYFILPKDTMLTEKHIETILLESRAVMFVLDGFDEYPGDIEEGSDILYMLTRQKFQEFSVIITTRPSSLPNRYNTLTKRIRLTGFDETSRRQYVRKAIACNDERAERIQLQLSENPLISDLCQIPLFFVMFAHTAQENDRFQKLHSVTSVFRYLISCFHSHMRNKMNDENVYTDMTLQNSHSKFEKFAFEALTSNHQKLVWSKEEISSRIGQSWHEQYVRIGILVEEEVIDINDNPETPISEHIQYKTEVTFYHKLFCEWYAAHHLSALFVQKETAVDLSVLLQHVDPLDLQYLLRFACGLNSYAVCTIIEYVKNVKDCETVAVLCIVEQARNINEIRSAITQICFEGLIIRKQDSLLLKKAYLSLLQVAGANGIPIEYVGLQHCVEAVDLCSSTPALRIQAGVFLSSRMPIKQLWITPRTKKMDRNDTADILHYASKCPMLQNLVFYGCFQPDVLACKNCTEQLKARQIEVLWYDGKRSDPLFLEFDSGQWKETLCADKTSRLFSKHKLCERNLGIG